MTLSRQEQGRALLAAIPLGVVCGLLWVAVCWWLA